MDNAVKALVKAKPRRQFPARIDHLSLMRDHLRISHPSRQYLGALVDPFAPEKHTVKLPYNSEHTQAVTVRGIVDVTIGINGCAFILGKPNIAGKDDYQVSRSGWNGLDITQEAAANANLFGYPLPKPYTYAQLTATSNTSADNQMSYRLVSAGMRATFTGKFTDRAGICYAPNMPNGGDLITSTSGLVSRASNMSKYNINNCDLFEVQYKPRTEEQKELINANQTEDVDFNKLFPSVMDSSRTYWDYTSASATSAGSSYGLLFTGCVPNTTFSVDVVEHWEFCGGAASQMVTPSVMDRAGASMAFHIAEITDGLHAKNETTSRTEHVLEAIENVAFGLEPVLAAGATAVFGPAGGLAVASGMEALKEFKAPINTVIDKVASSFRKLFHLR